MKNRRDKKVQNIKSLSDNFFSQISPEVATTFTKEQIEALNKCCQSCECNERLIDLRISVLIPLLSFYLVILAGEERRSKQRLQYERSFSPLWTFSNSCFLIMFSMIIVTGSISSLFFIKSLIPKERQVAFPTSIPWIKSQDDCERGNRNWKDNRCWDSQHSPDF
ncbi:hypothetical protein A0J48_008965 [Sphaerospermopsis aphanizomenoides BCCUSP55]|uniref:hypothetical protein n=1 Tax=Sphaerospermopsis aphanizomenoides TaxID=459663 RepID=UPI001907D2C6|nr:hypothetical protein [Sphaerospermopsis aphanizomenoides]MBK1987663.1 hypothetical protein [Sphaerospermopsis aphanizomenoides BCCUSP55]